MYCEDIVGSVKLKLPVRAGEQGNWASKASPTLGCSIEISRDIYMCLSWAKKSRRNNVGQTRACSKSVMGGKIRPVTSVLFISTIR